MNRETLGILEDRAATYGLLARLYHREVDEALLFDMGHLDLSSTTDSETLDAGVRLMSAYLGECGPDALTELAVDYARLFLVRSAHATEAPYPYESVYASENRTVMGCARDQVLASYREEGLDKGASWNLAEDHIALELEFMQVLCKRTAEAFRAGDEAEVERLSAKQQDFLEHHLLSWTPLFVDAMESTAHTDWYRGLASFTKGFLVEDGKLLAQQRR